MNIRIKSSHFLARFRTELWGFFLGLRINLGKMYLSLSAKTWNFWQFFWRLFPGFLTDPSKLELSGDLNRNFMRKSRRMWRARYQIWSTSIRDCNSRKSVRFLKGKWGYVGSWKSSCWKIPKKDPLIYFLFLFWDSQVFRGIYEAAFRISRISRFQFIIFVAFFLPF